MLPCQASTLLRYMARPCFRLYAQHCTSLSVWEMKLELQKLSTAAVRNSDRCNTRLAVTSPASARHLFCLHSSRPFLTSCSVCDAVQQQANDAEIKALRFENGEKARAILEASFENLMQMASKVESAFHACLILQRLSSLHKEGKTPAADGDTLLQDNRLSTVLKMIDENITRLSSKAILNTLQGLYEITDTDVYIVKSLLMQMLWLMRRLPIPVVIQVIQLHLNHKESSQRESVVQQAMTVLERRWVELTSPKDIIFLMYTTQRASSGGQALMERLEDRALDIVEKASPKDLYRIIYILCRQGHRNTPLIRAVVYHLNKSSVSSLSAIQLTNLTYALCVLNVFDTSILSKISDELNNRRADLTPKLVSSLMASFSRLRWRENSVVQMLMNVLDEKATFAPTFLQEMETADSGRVLAQKSSAGLLDVSDRVGLMLSLANLNVDSVQSRSLIEKIARLDDLQSLRQSSPLLWLDIVWSLSVLQMVDASSAASVLTEDFWGKLPSTDSFQSVVNLIKVKSIDIAARYELEDYTGPFLPPTITAADAKLLQKGERKVAEKVVSALTNMAPSETYTLVNTTAPGGYLIDAEFYVDSSGKPKPLSQVSQNATDCHRVALKVLDFPDLTLPTSDLTGLHAMAVRHLRCQGYTVIQVKHSEVSAKNKVVELVNLLQRKVKDALKVSPTAPADS